MSFISRGRAVGPERRQGLKLRPAFLLSCCLAAVLQPVQGLAQEKSGAPRANPQPTPARRDGQHDFDFEIGTWKTHLRRLLHPLTGSTTWVEYEGTTAVRKVWNGRANLVELTADGPAVKRLLVVELAAPAPELADGGLGHDAAVRVGEVETPLA